MNVCIHILYTHSFKIIFIKYKTYQMSCLSIDEWILKIQYIYKME